jgi:hypothetical protein
MKNEPSSLARAKINLMDGEIVHTQTDYTRLDAKAMTRRLLIATSLSSSDAEILVSDAAGREKAVEILVAHDRTRQRQDRISRNREILRASALG